MPCKDITHMLAESLRWEQICLKCIGTLHSYSISCCAFFPCFQEHSKWKEAETWKSEKRSAKGYEVGRKREREHLKADLGNMQGQRAPEIVAVISGFCLAYLWHWRWNRNNLFGFKKPPFRLTWHVMCRLFHWLKLFTLLIHVRSSWLCLCWRLFKSLERSPSVARCSPGQCACALLTLR